MSGERGQFTFFFFLFFCKRSYLRAVVSRSVEQSEVAEGTEGFLAECLPKRKACPQGAMRFFSSQSAFACRLRNVFIHGLARILCKLVIIFILFFYLYRSKVQSLEFHFSAQRRRKTNRFFVAQPPEQGSPGSSLANNRSLSYVKWYRWLFINYPC